MKESCYKDITYKASQNGNILDITIEDSHYMYKGQLAKTGELKLNVYKRSGSPEQRIRVRDLNNFVKVLNVIQRARKESNAK